MAVVMAAVLPLINFAVALIELAERTVKQKFGVALEREVRIVGEPA